ncbi:MAG: hypothetical protein ACYTGC_11090 [Planctomycetota bacterium]|jgi:hypothetical protein
MGPIQSVLAGGASVLILLLGSEKAVATPQQSSSPSSCATPEAASEFALVSAMVHDASVRMDGDGLQLARTRLEPFLNDDALAVQAGYLAGLADFASLMSPSMGSLSVDPDEARLRLERAQATLEGVVERDPKHVEALCTLAVSEQFLGALSPDAKEALAESSRRRLERAGEVAPDDPTVTAARAFVALMGSTAQKEGMTLLEQATAAYRARATGDRAVDGRWWPLITRGMSVRVAMMGGKSHEALALVEECLALEPDFALVAGVKPTLESMIAAQGDGFNATAWDDLPDVRWVAAADDGAGDGREASLADARALSYAIQRDRELIWFRFDLNDSPNPEAFGVNVIVDSDGDQESGMGWWGTNSAFTWDRLITVWLARGDNGRYTGTAGVGDLEGAQRADFSNLHRGGIAFSISEQDRTIVIGVPRSYFGASSTLHVVGAVGSNQAWNDDVPDSGHVTIELN